MLCNFYQGIKHSDDEPKKTLKTFRNSMNPNEQLLSKNAPFFGVNLGIDEYGGIINVGDQVEVIKKSTKNMWHLMPVFLLFPLPFLAMFIDHEDNSSLEFIQSQLLSLYNKIQV